MAEVQMIIGWDMILILIWVVAGILILIGLINKDAAIRSIGLIVLGLTSFASPVAFYLHETGDSWGPSSGDILILGILAFLGGIFLAVGVITYSRSSGGKSP